MSHLPIFSEILAEKCLCQLWICRNRFNLCRNSAYPDISHVFALARFIIRKFRLKGLLSSLDVTRQSATSARRGNSVQADMAFQICVTRHVRHRFMLRATVWKRLDSTLQTCVLLTFCCVSHTFYGCWESKPSAAAAAGSWPVVATLPLIASCLTVVVGHIPQAFNNQHRPTPAYTATPRTAER